MANAVTLKDKNGVECYPKSHVKQIMDSSGKTQETINKETSTKLTELEGVPVNIDSKVKSLIKHIGVDKLVSTDGDFDSIDITGIRCIKTSTSWEINIVLYKGDTKISTSSENLQAWPNENGFAEIKCSKGFSLYLVIDMSDNSFTTDWTWNLNAVIPVSTWPFANYTFLKGFREMAEKSNEFVDEFVPKPYNFEGTIAISGMNTRIGNALFSASQMQCLSSNKQYQYATVYINNPKVGDYLYARAGSREGGSGQVVRIKLSNDKYIFANAGETAYIKVDSSYSQVEINFILCTSTALGNDTSITFNDVECGYIEAYGKNIKGILYDNKKAIVNLSDKKIFIPKARWWVCDDIKGKTYLIEDKTLNFSDVYGGFLIFDANTKDYQYVPFSSDSSTSDVILSEGKYIIGAIHQGQGADLIIPFIASDSVDVSSMEGYTYNTYKSLGPISLQRGIYPFLQKTVYTRVLQDEEADNISWSANQSMAIFGGYAFAFFDYWDDSSKAKAPICVFNVGTWDIVCKAEYPETPGINLVHNNSAQFSTEYYEDGDEFPLLYVSAYFGQSQGALFVMRVTRQENDFSFEIVQTVKSSNASVLKYGNSWCVDSQNRYLYMYYNINGNYTVTENNDIIIERFNLPSCKDGDVTLGDEDVIGLIRFPFVVFQGSVFYNGKIFMGAQGRNSFLEQGDYVLSINFEKNIIESIIPVQGGEPEGVSVYEEKMYTSHRATGQSDPESVVFSISEFLFI